MQYLVDTDWIIDHLHQVDRVVHRMEELAPAGLGVSIVSLAELYDGVFGAADPERSEQALRTFIDRVHIVDLNEAVCRIFARERSRLRSAGTPVPDFDLLIGSTAIRHNLTLLTNNRRHFERLPGLSIVSV